METPFASMEFVIDYAKYIKFQKFQRRKGLTGVFNRFVIILGAVGVLLVFLYYLNNGFQWDQVLMLGLIVFAFALLFLKNFYLPKLRFKGIAKALQVPRKVELFSEYFTVESSSPQFSGQNRIKYGALAKAYETNDTYYLYLDKYQAFLLPKDLLRGEETARLRTLLGEELGDNFKL